MGVAGPDLMPDFTALGIIPRCRQWGFPLMEGGWEEGGGLRCNVDIALYTPRRREWGVRARRG